MYIYYLRILKFGHIGSDVEADAVDGSWQGHASDQQNYEKYVWKQRCEIDNLLTR